MRLILCGVAFLSLISIPKAEAQLSNIGGRARCFQEKYNCRSDAFQLPGPTEKTGANSNRKQKENFFTGTEIYFVTNRDTNTAPSQSDLPQIYGMFNSQPPQVGVLIGKVSVLWPANRKAADQTFAGSPSELNPIKNFFLAGHEFIETFQDLIKSIERDGSDPATNSKSTLIYFHGFQNSFVDTVERMAQLTADYEFKGPKIVFSWPSDIEGRRMNDEIPVISNHYVAAKEAKDESIDDATAILRLFYDQTAWTTNLIGHSMGSDLLLQAISKLSAEKGDEFRQFARSVILAAPDADVKEFLSAHHSHLQRASRRVTLYCSPEDRILVQSLYRSVEGRLGECGPKLPQLHGVDVVRVHRKDVIRTGFFNKLTWHSYFANSLSVLMDARLFLLDLPLPEARGLKGDGWQWRFTYKDHRLSRQ